MMKKLYDYDWQKTKKTSLNLFTKLIRTKDVTADDVDVSIGDHPKKSTHLSKCLDTVDLVSLGVGSCVGTGMYLVTGMVAHNVAGPGVIFSFIIAAVASIFSGASYAEFGVRVPHTTGSAYMYSYVTVGEFVAFVIGWNMSLEYLIGTSACARALSACFESLSSGSVSIWTANNVGTFFGQPLDLFAFGVTLLMTAVLLAGVKKSLMFNNILNIINFSVWVFIMTAGLFYVDTENWTQHKGFLPYGWNGVFTGAATCFYAFIGFDVIATTGEEANNPKRSIPLAIVGSLCIILCAYVTTSMMLTLVVPFDSVDTDSGIVEMFAYVNAPTCQYIVAIGAIAGLTVSMFGSMFPMPRVIYAMAQDGLIFRQLSAIWQATGTPAVATLVGGLAAAFVALIIRLDILVEMMSIGTLLAYTLVSTCVLILRYQPNQNNLIELLPHHLRTPVADTDNISEYKETKFVNLPQTETRKTPSSNQRIMVRRVTRTSPDSDDSIAPDEEYNRDDQYLVSETGNTFYGSVHGTPGNATSSNLRNVPVFDFILRKLETLTYLCPGLFPWVDLGPATESSGYFVMRCVGILYVFIIIFDMTAAYGSPGSSATTFFMVVLFLGMLFILLIISRKPQNRNPMLYMCPGLPFVPAIAVTVNIYLTLNLSILTLVRFTIWMIIGLILYFKYGIKNSTLAQQPLPESETVCSPEPKTTWSQKLIPPHPTNSPNKSKSIFEGDHNQMYSAQGYRDPLLAWDEAEKNKSGSSSSKVTIEHRYDAKTNLTSTHAAPSIPMSRPPWACNDYSTWDD